MNRFLAAAILLVTPSILYAQFQKATPPVAEKKEHWRILHGDTVLDNYFWMYDYFGKGPDSTKAVDYLVAENAYMDSVMAPSKKFQAALYAEMKARIQEKDEDVPVFQNGYFYYSRTEKGQEYYKYCRKKGSLAAKEEILLDVDKMAAGHPYFAVTGFKISEDNKLIAFGVDTLSRRQYTIYVKNLETGKLLPDAIENTEGDPCWANDNHTLFYTSKHPVTLLSEKIRKHELGKDPSGDPVVYDETDKSNYIGLIKSKNGKFIFIYSSATLSSEYQFIDANKPQDAFKTFQPRIKNVIYDVIALADRFLILTNKDEATNFKLMECPLEKTSEGNWKEVIPHRPNVLLQSVEEFKDFLVINERKDGLVRMRVRKLSGNTDHYIDFGEAAYDVNFNSNPDYKSKVLRYNYTSLKTPYAVYDYNMAGKTKKLMKQELVVGGYNPMDYITERLMAPAADGKKIPVSLVYKKGFKKDGHGPLLLYAYGSYGNSSDPYFSNTRLSLLNRGFVFAIAHVRGGQELGRQWYEDGKLLKKKNTFTDFINCAQYLIREKYTSKEHIYAQGLSAGGLLMGAITTMEPDLWHGVIADVPFVDVVNTMLDENIPLTSNEFDEWGNPKDKEVYEYMKTYNPYENVSRRTYPNLLVTTGLHDSQVQYFEPAKWVAKLRTLNTSNNQLLLHTNMNFGHLGASGRFDYLKDRAMDYAFFLNLEGIYK